MPYTLGAAHTLTGQGSTPIAGPVGLRLALTGIPAASKSRRARTPTEYFGLGQLAVGNADGWLQAVDLRFASQLVYPLPDSTTVLAWDLTAGLQVVATELAPVVTAVPLTEIWQRNPAPSGTTWTGWNPAGSPTTTMGVVTVPAGRRLMLTTAKVQLVRLGAAPAASALTAACTFTVDGVAALAICYLSGPTLFVYDDVSGPLFLGPGQSFRATYVNQEASGGCYAVCNWAGTYFDA